MTTFFLDYEGGNDANDGLTFANRWKTVDGGATAARIAPGDTIRIMASTDPTLLGSCTWRSFRHAGTFQSFISATNATPIVITTPVEHGFVDGQPVRITSSTGNTNAIGLWMITVIDAFNFSLNGSTGNGSGTGGTVYDLYQNNLTIPAGLIQAIASYGNAGDGRTVWTASSNITATLVTSNTAKFGHAYESIAANATFTTGKAAYKTLAAPLDLSGFQQLSLYFAQSVGTLLAAADISIKLCSDTTGDVPVNSFDIPAQSLTNRWQPLALDFGAALGSSIQSVALYINVDKGAQTFLIDGLIACKAPSAADSVSLTSLIGQDVAGETWWPVASIVGTRLLLGGYPGEGYTGSARGYYGAEGSFTTYKREAIKLSPLGTDSNAINNVTEGGVTGSPITFSGGWNRTDMSTQTGDTFLDGQNGVGTCFTPNGLSFVDFDRLSVSRYSRAFGGTSSLSSFSDINVTNSHVSAGSTAVSAQFCSNIGVDAVSAAGMNSTIFLLNGVDCSIGTLPYVGGSSGGLIAAGARLTIGEITRIGGVGSCSFSADEVTIGSLPEVRYTNSVTFSGNYARVGLIDTRFNATRGVSLFSIGTRIESLISLNNLAENLYVQGRLYIHSATLNDTEFGSGEASSSTLSGTVVKIDSLNGSLPVSLFYGGSIQAIKTFRHTASGYAWDFRPTLTVRGQNYPLPMSLAKIACAANVAKTCTLWVRRDNTNIKGQMLVRGGQIAGVTSDVTTACEPTMGTWTQYTLTFTPTEDGVVELEFRAWDGIGTSNHLIIDDLEITP